MEREYLIPKPNRPPSFGYMAEYREAGLVMKGRNYWGGNGHNVNAIGVWREELVRGEEIGEEGIWALAAKPEWEYGTRKDGVRFIRAGFNERMRHIEEYQNGKPTVVFLNTDAEGIEWHLEHTEVRSVCNKTARQYFKPDEHKKFQGIDYLKLGAEFANHEAVKAYVEFINREALNRRNQAEIDPLPELFDLENQDLDRELVERKRIDPKRPAYVYLFVELDHLEQGVTARQFKVGMSDDWVRRRKELTQGLVWELVALSNERVPLCARDALRLEKRIHRELQKPGGPHLQGEFYRIDKMWIDRIAAWINAYS